MGLAKISFVGALVLAIAVVAGARDIAGAYTGEYDDEVYMLIARDIGGDIYYFDFLLFDEELDIGTARQQPDGRYMLETDDGRVLMRFEEGVCLFMNMEYDETLELEKLFGPAGREEGVYALDMHEDEALGLFTMQRSGENLNVSLAGWEKEVSGHAEDDERNLYVVGDRYSGIEISFEVGGCTVTENGQTIVFDKDERRDLYFRAAEPAAGTESVAGVYRGRSGDTVLLVAVREIGGSIFSFEGGRFFWKWPKKWPYPVTIRFGKPIHKPESVEQAALVSVNPNRSERAIA